MPDATRSPTTDTGGAAAPRPAGARELTLRRRHWLSDSIYELVLERGDLQFEPGNCMSLAAPDGTTRPYSIASGTGEDCLRFLIRRLPEGQVSGSLATLEPGATVVASPPFGWFRPGGSAGSRPYIYIATSTGIAPFLSALRSGLVTPPERILYGVRLADEAAGLTELQAHAPTTLAVSRQPDAAAAGHHPGRVTDLLPDVTLTDQTQVYLCGLDAMITEVSDWLEDRGLDFTQIHREVFFHARY